MVNGLELLSYKAKLSKIGLFSLKKGKLWGGGVLMCINIHFEGGKKMEADSSQ